MLNHSSPRPMTDIIMSSSSSQYTTNSTSLNSSRHIGYTIEVAFFSLASFTLLTTLLTQVLVYRFTLRRRWSRAKSQLLCCGGIAILIAVPKNIDPDNVFGVVAFPATHSLSLQMTGMLVHCGALILLGSLRSLSLLLHNKPVPRRISNTLLLSTCAYHICVTIVGIYLGLIYTRDLPTETMYRVLIIRDIAYSTVAVCIMLPAWYSLGRLHYLTSQHIRQLELHEVRSKEKLVEGVKVLKRIKSNDASGIATTSKQLALFDSKRKLSNPQADDQAQQQQQTASHSTNQQQVVLLPLQSQQQPQQPHHPPSCLSPFPPLTPPPALAPLSLPQVPPTTSATKANRLLGLVDPITATTPSSKIVKSYPSTLHTLSPRISFLGPNSDGRNSPLQQQCRLLHPSLISSSPHSVLRRPSSSSSFSSSSARILELRSAASKVLRFMFIMSSLVIISIIPVLLKHGEYVPDDFEVQDSSRYVIENAITPIVQYGVMAVVLWFAWCSPQVWLRVLRRGEKGEFVKGLMYGIQEPQQQHPHPYPQQSHPIPPIAGDFNLTCTNSRKKQVADLSILVPLPLPTANLSSPEALRALQPVTSPLCSVAVLPFEAMLAAGQGQTPTMCEKRKSDSDAIV